jgi:hypothetical protein
VARERLGHGTAKYIHQHPNVSPTPAIGSSTASAARLLRVGIETIGREVNLMAPWIQLCALLVGMAVAARMLAQAGVDLRVAGAARAVPERGANKAGARDQLVAAGASSSPACVALEILKPGLDGKGLRIQDCPLNVRIADPEEDGRALRARKSPRGASSVADDPSPTKE